MKSLRVIIILSLYFCFAGQSHGAGLCPELLSRILHSPSGGPKAHLNIDGTNGLMAYLSDLLQHQIIGDNELKRFLSSLERGEIKNPITEEETWVSSAAMIHREALQEYIDLTHLDIKRLREFTNKSIKERDRVRVAREETREEAKEIDQKMIFNPVPAGSFRMGEKQNQVDVTLTHPFEMMSTAVTQKMWVELMGENPSHFKDGAQTVSILINGKSIKLQPDHPVESVTWWSVVEYANRLSIKKGLKPAYDLSGVRFKSGTSAEAGTLSAESGELKINAPGGDIYRAEGYRLPTEAEQEYVLRNLGKAKGNYHFGDDVAQLKDYAWFDKNSGGMTHPVAQLRPLTINGYDFYDLHGNVWEWSHDRKDELKGGVDPQGPRSGSNRVVRGGSWSSYAHYLRSAGRNSCDPGDRYDNVGFRLVRTAK